MLKIKANKMKDLEKFGFYRNEFYPNYVKDLIYNSGYADILAVDINTRQITRSIHNGLKHIDCKRVAKNVIQDLIKADMIEKVEE